MGGYGAILVAELYPRRFRAVAAISPAVWTSYAQAAAVSPAAYDSAAQFAAYDMVTHAAALARTPVRIASGLADPFHPGVVALADRLGTLPRSCSRAGATPGRSSTPSCPRRLRSSGHTSVADPTQICQRSSAEN